VSPSVYTLHPILAFFPDCGLGSDPNASGPCTGTLTPDHLGDSVTGVFSTGPGVVASIGAALLALAAMIMLLRMVRRLVGDETAPASDAADVESCRDCGASVSPGCDSPYCDACFAAHIDGLQPGEAWCANCGATYWTDPDRDPCDDDSGCPCCGSGGVTDDAGDVGVCSVCGVQSDELVGDLFPACPDCAAASEAAARDSEIDDGPDDEETFGGNPDGVGGGGVRA
jgi:hypothetical protein